MRIHVLAEDGISPQARTYAEYRVFAALSQIVDTEQVRDARVVLRPMKRQGGGEAVSCTVTVALDPAGALRVRTAGAHAYAAINRAVDLLRSKKPQKVSVGMPVESASRYAQVDRTGVGATIGRRAR